MATTAIWGVTDRLKRVLAYTQADAKTEKQLFVSGINCDPKTAYEQMQRTKRQFQKTEGILAFHRFQAFAPGEATPEVAHAIGVKLVGVFMKRWADINTIYNAPTFAIENGSIVRVQVDLDKKLDEGEDDFLSSFIDSWTFPKEGKYIRPFKLLNFYLKENLFEVEIKYRKKDAEIDELRLFFQDLMHYFNYYQFHIIKWDCMVLSE